MSVSPAPPQHRLCVYCGSSPGADPAYMEAAKALGTSLAQAGVGLVYGGGNTGLMGQVARACLEAGGHVAGIIPEFLVAKESTLHGLSELIITKTMHERKTLMFEKATGFVALPGGIGTLEELAEIATWAQLKQHNKPIIIADIAGYWDHLLALLIKMQKEQFIREETAVELHAAKTAHDVLPLYFAALSRNIAQE